MTDRDCDLVLLDLNMPGVRGFSGLLLLRAQYPDIPVMIISAVEDNTVIRRAFELGAAGYLHKSVGTTEIRRAIETVLSGEVFVPEGTSLGTDDNHTALMRRLAHPPHAGHCQHGNQLAAVHVQSVTNACGVARYRRVAGTILPQPRCRLGDRG